MSQGSSCYPELAPAELIELTARWVADGGPLLGKPPSRAPRTAGSAQHAHRSRGSGRVFSTASRGSDASVRDLFRRGLVIPAHPLALDAGRKLDERRQRALTALLTSRPARAAWPWVSTPRSSPSTAPSCCPPVLELAAETAREAGREIVMVAARDRPDRAGRGRGGARQVRSATTWCCSAPTGS
ncbi:hypothetical protein [Nonomuraea dietziae]|uniref:hypothetical protein n=1 Tax=Nonomuraea dietziae TaxID=65515 RepID=UPI0031DF22AF